MKHDEVLGQKQVAWDAGSSQKPEDGIVAVAASFEDFSVVVAARNAAATIQRTLWSIAAQTLSPREIVLVDDDSGDDTVAAAQRSGVAVHILRVAFRNAAAARNAGVRIAGGHWIAFLDADDEWYPAHLAGAANLLSKGGDIAFLAAADYVSVGAVTPPRPGPLMSQPRRNLRDQELIELFRKSSWFCNCTTIVSSPKITFNHAHHRTGDPNSEFHTAGRNSRWPRWTAQL